MASGRSVNYFRSCRDSHHKPQPEELRSFPQCGHRYKFQQPRAIAQSNALSSCYSRFRFESKYMLQVDDNEFVALAPSKPNPEEEDVEQGMQANRKHNSKKPVITNLVTFADQEFQLHPHKVALGFQPVYMHACNQSQITAQSKIRLKEYTNGILGPLYEKKLLVRTDFVGMVFVHYLNLLDDVNIPADKVMEGNQDLESYVHMLPSDRAALYHYRERSISSIFGLTFPKFSNEYERKGDIYTCEDESITNYVQVLSAEELQNEIFIHQDKNVSSSELLGMAGRVIFDHGRKKVVIAMDKRLRTRIIKYVFKRQKMYRNNLSLHGFEKLSKD